MHFRLISTFDINSVLKTIRISKIIRIQIYVVLRYNLLLISFWFHNDNDNAKYLIADFCILILRQK